MTGRYFYFQFMAEKYCAVDISVNSGADCESNGRRITRGFHADSDVQFCVSMGSQKTLHRMRRRGTDPLCRPVVSCWGPSWHALPPSPYLYPKSDPSICCRGRSAATTRLLGHLEPLPSGSLVPLASSLKSGLLWMVNGQSCRVAEWGSLDANIASCPFNHAAST